MITVDRLGLHHKVAALIDGHRVSPHIQQREKDPGRHANPLSPLKCEVAPHRPYDALLKGEAASAPAPVELTAQPAGHSLDEPVSEELGVGLNLIVSVAHVT